MEEEYASSTARRTEDFPVCEGPWTIIDEAEGMCGYSKKIVRDGKMDRERGYERTVTRLRA